MSWLSIISSILAVVGPLISRLLETWLENRLKDAVAKVGAPTGDTAADTRRLLGTVYAGIPWSQPGRWWFVRKLLADVPRAVATGAKLTHAQMKAIADAAPTA